MDGCLFRILISYSYLINKSIDLWGSFFAITIDSHYLDFACLE